MLTIDYYRKLVEPFSPLFLIIAILPFAIETRKRRVALSSLGVGFMVGLIYYTLMQLGIALGKEGIILPIFSAGLAPIIFLTLGISGMILVK